jgi:hypothetical protein
VVVGVSVASPPEDAGSKNEEIADGAADNPGMVLSPLAEVASALGASSTLDGDGSAAASLLLLLLGAGLGAGLAGAARAVVQQCSVTKRGRESRGMGGRWRDGKMEGKKQAVGNGTHLQQPGRGVYLYQSASS